MTNHENTLPQYRQLITANITAHTIGILLSTAYYIAHVVLYLVFLEIKTIMIMNLSFVVFIMLLVFFVYSYIISPIVLYIRYYDSDVENLDVLRIYARRRLFILPIIFAGINFLAWALNALFTILILWLTAELPPVHVILHLIITDLIGGAAAGIFIYLYLDNRIQHQWLAFFSDDSDENHRFDIQFGLRFHLTMLFIISSLIPTFIFVIITYLKSYEIIFDEPLASHQSLKLSLFVFGAICVTLSFFTIRLFGNSIISALKQFQEAADAIRQGDFSRVIPRFTNKEMNELRSSLYQIVEELKNESKIL